MATSINILVIDFGNTPTVVQYCTISYKLLSDSSWIIFNNNCELNTDGTPETPQTITGLTSGQTYNVMATSNCASPPSFWTAQFTLP